MKLFIKTVVITLMSLAFVSLSAHTKPGDRLCVNKQFLKSGLAVKAEPDRESDTVMIVGSGRMVLEFGRQDGWVNVGIDRSGGRDGYVPEDALSKEDLDGLPCGS